MAFVDYYKILGVDKNIPQKDVREAYRKRAKQFHPDLHPNDPKAKAKFQALNEAYEVINDPEKRKKYDQYGEQWKEAGKAEDAGFGGFHWGGSGGGSPFEGFDFSSIRGGGSFSSFFENLFGSMGGRQSSRQASSQKGVGEMNATINIDLYTAMLGGEVIVQLSNGTKLRLKVKPETQPGTKVRIRGKGYDKGNGTFGDLIITYQVNLPTNLSERQKSLLREMREA
ncbi:MAG: J domain-containing protein [Prevotella sp.]|nr:J domain-containing protein [Prevotella sp.]MBQ6210536.1 J domain-containing protein [Prevotella sp.]